MQQRILIAGVGNIFLGDDGFGVAVAQRLAAESLPDGVQVADFGIRGMHLAYDILDNDYETIILADTTPRGGKPGTVYLIEPDLEALHGDGHGSADAHGMHVEAVFGLLHALGGVPGRVLIVGCEPARLAEEMALSAPVTAAVTGAVQLILQLVHHKASALPPATPGASPAPEATAERGAPRGKPGELAVHV
jgi:hydrogenase maturation protease